MGSKITIIGAGSVGATIAFKLSYEDIASEIVMIDINKDKVEGEVMDIEQGTCFRSPISIIAGDYEDAKDSDIVIITSGIARKPGQTRIELAQTNVNIIKRHRYLCIQIPAPAETALRKITLAKTAPVKISLVKSAPVKTAPPGTAAKTIGSGSLAS